MSRFSLRDLAVVLGLLLAHFFVVSRASGVEDLASAPFQIAAELLAAWGCCKQARASRSRARLGWSYLALACVLTAANTLSCLWVYRWQGASYDYANISDYFYVLNYIAALLAVTWSKEEPPSGRLLWIDLVLLGICLLLSYVVLFDRLPFSDRLAQPVPADILVFSFNLMNGALVVFAIARLIGRSAQSYRAVFDRSLALFILLFEPIVCIYNLYFESQPGPQDTLIALPFLVLWLITNRPRPEAVAEERRNSFALIIDSIGPAIFTAVAISLGVVVGQTHTWLGFWMVVSVFAMSAMRGAVRQSRYIRLQEQLLEANRTLEHISFNDGLTGIANRRRFDLVLGACYELAKRNGSPLSLLLIDIDHFKALNDSQGHLKGDECLIQVAGALRANILRASDLSARYGGEEFAVLLPETDLTHALTVAHRLLSAIEALRIHNPSASGPHLSISIGAASLDLKSMHSASQLVDAADAALYRAKHAGRARVRSHFA